MRKTRYIFISLALAAMAVSCNKDVAQPATPSHQPLPEGEKVSVTINAVVNPAADTKAPSTTPIANSCYIYISFNGAEVYTARVKGSSGSFTFPDITLVRDAKYQVSLWADTRDDSGNGAYTLSGHTATLSGYSSGSTSVTIEGNSQNREAFCYHKADLTVSDLAQAITLERKMATVSIKASDIATAVTSATGFDKVSVTYAAQPVSFNISDGSLSGSVDLVYANPVSVYATSEELATDYIFVPASGKVSIDLQMYKTVGDSSAGTEQDVPCGNYPMNDITVAANHSTSVTCKLADKVMTVVENRSDLEAAFTKDQETVLACDLTVANVKGVGSGKHAVIDLNGHTISYGTKVSQSGLIATTGQLLNVYKGAKMTIKNGTIDARNFKETANTNNAVIGLAGNGAVLNLENVTILSNNSAVRVKAKITGGEISIKNCTIAADYFCIGTDATAPATSGVTVTVENSKLMTTESGKTSRTPIFWNVPCELIVKNTEIVGMKQGALIRGGVATFTDCSITFNHDNCSDDASTDAAAYRDTDWGTGNAVPCAALTVGNRSSTSYQYPTTLNLVNTTVKTEGTDASLFPAIYTYANSGEGLGVTITYDEQTRDKMSGNIIVGSDNVTVNAPPGTATTSNPTR